MSLIEWYLLFKIIVMGMLIIVIFPYIVFLSGAIFKSLMGK